MPFLLRIPMTERQLLTKIFQQDRSLVRLITYAGIRDERIRKVTQYSLLLSGQPPLSKIEVLLAFSTGRMSVLRPNIETDEAVKALNLKAVKKITDRRVVDMDVAVGDMCRITLRNGVVISGRCKAVTKYNIVVEIRGELVLVYKHGIYAITET